MSTVTTVPSSSRLLQDPQGKVFTIEHTLDPVSAVFLYPVASQVAGTGYTAEQVERQLELLLSRCNRKTTTALPEWTDT